MNAAPDPLVVIRQQAWRAFERGDLLALQEHVRRLLKHPAGAAEGHFLSGMGQLSRARPDLALAHLERATALQPSSAWLAQLARALVQLRREREALTTADRAAALQPRDPLTRDTLGCVYSHGGRHEQALPLFEAAVAQCPRHLQYLYNLASTLGFLGRFAEAEQRYEQIIAIEPRFVKAHAALPGLRKQTPESNHVARLETLVADARPDEYLHLGYALAREYEDLGRYDDAFSVLERDNRRRKAELGYDIGLDRRNVERMMQRFREDGYFRGEGDPDPSPIFVVGLPRTGTTLVDRILASHPWVESAGELQLMPVALKRLVGTPSPLVLDADTIDAAAGLDPAALGRRYLDECGGRRHNLPRFTDKLPLNFLHVGYIARALPNARIVCLRRHPLDSVWSNFKHLFSTRFSYYNYSYDLLDAAAYYVLFDRLMAFWQQHFPGRILEVCYEDLVEDQQAQTRRLLTHCGLKWADSCLSFHENAAAVATPSAAQVRQPIYRSALARWRAYEKHLQPVIEYFEGNGIAL